MGKNNPVIEYAKKCKILDKEIETVTPAIYASIAIAMNTQGFDNETISNIFGHSQEIWEFHQEHHTRQYTAERYLYQVQGAALRFRDPARGISRPVRRRR